MDLRTKRWNDPIDPDDGHRVLICRYRPRGVARARETWHEWRPELAPSATLLAAYLGKKGDPIDWKTYRARYLEEMKAQKPTIAALAERLHGTRPLTLLCASTCTDPARCHRTLLAALIEKAARRA